MLSVQSIRERGGINCGTGASSVQRTDPGIHATDNVEVPGSGTLSDDELSNLLLW